TRVQLSTREGALLVGEVGWSDAPAAGDDGAFAPARWGIGAWSYPPAFTPLDDTGWARNAGAYVLAQVPLVTAPRGRTTAFMRAGVANSSLNPIEAALDAGVLVGRPWGDDGPAALTAGIAGAAPGSTYRRLLA